MVEDKQSDYWFDEEYVRKMRSKARMDAISNTM